MFQAMIEDAPAARLPTRIALLSIAGIWGLYWTILSFRSLFLYKEAIGLFGWRALVTVASAGITWLVYLVLRRIPARRLGASITAAALLALPGALAYSTINYVIFHHADAHKRDEWFAKHGITPETRLQTTPAPPAPPAPPVSNGMYPVAPPAPPAPPGVSPAMTVGALIDEDEMSTVGQIADQAGNGYFFFAAWAALYLALCYAAEVGALERRTATLRAAAQAAELRALRYQINPHFLFNTLNSLSSLVMTGKRDEAERMLLNLSSFFRTSLTGDPTEDVPLGEEILLQRLYLDIEQVRFPTRLRVAFDVPQALETVCVPGLILQPVVENAVKYGVSRTTRPVTVTIRAEEAPDALRLIVTDDGDPAPAHSGVEGTGTGLRNVRDRLAARYGDAGQARWGATKEGGFSVVLEMPMIRNGC
jgi:two-component system, LytTR family, sensor kinase